MKKLLGILPALGLFLGHVQAGEILFQDDFESGFNPQWLVVGSAVTIVTDPENPANHVAAFDTGKGAELKSPPVAVGDWKSAAEKEEEMEAWADYELSFRFRVEKVENLPEDAVANNSAIFRIGTRITPEEENPLEQRHLHIGLWRPGMGWRVVGPRIPWYGNHGDMEFTTHVYAGKADTNWNTFRVIHRGERTEVYFNDKLVYGGSDDRAMRGGFDLTRLGSNLVDVGTFYVDDIIVKKLDDSNQ